MVPNVAVQIMWAGVSAGLVPSISGLTTGNREKAVLRIEKLSKLYEKLSISVATSYINGLYLGQKQPLVEPMCMLRVKVQKMHIVETKIACRGSNLGWGRNREYRIYPRFGCFAGCRQNCPNPIELFGFAKNVCGQRWHVDASTQAAVAQIK